MLSCIKKVSDPDFILVVILKNCWDWAFLDSTWTLQCVYEGVLFSRLLKGLIGGSFI